MVSKTLLIPMVCLELMLSVKSHAEESHWTIGADLSGRECHAQARFASPPDPLLPTPIDLYCGDTHQVVASLDAYALNKSLPENKDQAAMVLQTAQALSAYGSSSALRMTCDKSGSITLAGRPAWLSACTLRNGGWQVIRFAVGDGAIMIQGDAPPILLPVLDRAITLLFNGTPQPNDLTGLIQAAQQATGIDFSALTSDQASDYLKLLETALVDNAEGNHVGAEQAYRKALDIQMRGLKKDDPALADTLMRLALEVSNQSRFDEAQSLFQRAEPLVARSADPLDKGRFALYLATNAMNSHHYAQARTYARQAEAIFSGVEAAPGSLSNGTLAKGEITHAAMIESAASIRLQDWSQASSAAALALHDMESLSGLPASWHADALTLMGEIEAHQGHAQWGQVLLKQAIDTYQTLYGPSRPLAMAWLALGRIYVQSGQYAPALEAFDKGLAPANGQGPIGFEALAPYFVANLDMADLNDAQHDHYLEGVLSALQRVQAATAQDSVSRVALQLAITDPKVADLVAKLDAVDSTLAELRIQLAAETARPENDRDPARIASLSQLVATSMTDKAEAEKALHAASPEYSRSDIPKFASVSEIRSKLNRDEGFVTFSFGQDFGIALVITPQTIAAFKVPLSAEKVASMVSSLRRAMVIRAGKAEVFDTALSYQLYAGLFGSAQSSLAGIKRLHVVTPAVLSSLPLALLVTAPPADGSMTKAEWFAKRYAVTEWPTARAFALLRHNGQVSKASHPFFGLGDPKFAQVSGGTVSHLAEQCRTDGPMPRELLAELPALPDTGIEVRKVGSLFQGADIVTGGEATEDAVRRRALKDYRILYFATHGLLPAESRCFSQPGLALTPPLTPATTKGSDGLLEATEIAGLKLDADLVVLSACNTATTSGQFGGHALMSLADSFFQAGARSVLATHWSVPSAPTLELMTSVFSHHEAGPGSDYAVSLQQAQLALINNPQTAHPINWAAFTLIGGTGEGSP